MFIRYDIARVEHAARRVQSLVTLKAHAARVYRASWWRSRAEVTIGYCTHC